MKATRLILPIFTFLPAHGAAAQPTEPASLARHFGFEPPRFLIADEGAGPALTLDANGDGLTDIAVVNNRASRIELFLQRPEPLSEADLAGAWKVNELPPSRWYERTPITAPHRIAALAARDLDGDGRLDLVYLAADGEVVTLRQDEGGDFDVEHRSRTPGVQPTRLGLAVADVLGDEAPEIVTLGAEGLLVLPYSPAIGFGEARPLGAGALAGSLAAVFAEDFDGDGRTDLLAAAPEDDAPLRLWLGREAEAPPGPGQTRRRIAAPSIRDRAPRPATPRRQGALGGALRFETPALREAAPVRFADRGAASIVVIERASRRIITYDLITRRERGDGGAIRSMGTSHGYPGGAQRDRPALAADIDGDGLVDVLAADRDGAAVLLYHQREDAGFNEPARFGAFKEPSGLAAGQWDADQPLEVFVLSEEEKVVGVAQYDAGSRRIGFPEPLRLENSGGAPVALTHFDTAQGPALAIVTGERRDYALEIHWADGERKTIDLPGVRRAPAAVRAGDIDGDGAPDLLALSPGQPMTLVLSGESGVGATALSAESTPQFGLVQAAGPNNTALLDVTGDGRDELLLADANFVRICRFDREGGWRVLEQATLPSAASDLTALAALAPGAADLEGASRRRPALVAVDANASELVFFGYAADAAGAPWRPVKRIDLAGTPVEAIEAGDLHGRGRVGVAALSGSGFSIIGLDGSGPALRPVTTFRSQRDDRLEHEAEPGDVNGDGFLDLIVLDAEEQMCQILTYGADRRLFFATEFQVFESRVFSGGERREFEPSEAHVADVTGDGAADLILVAHDRVIVHPQMTEPEQ